MTYSPTGVKSAETGERFPPLTHSASELALPIWLHHVRRRKKVMWIRFRSPWATYTLVVFVYDLNFRRPSIEICELRNFRFGNIASRKDKITSGITDVGLPVPPGGE